MSLVVDASCVVAALVDGEENGIWAREILQADDLVAPELMLVEVGSVLRKLQLSKRLSQFEAAGAHRDLLRMKIRHFPYAPLATLVWQLRENITTFDASYVALAASLETDLATLDIKLSRAAKSLCRCLTPPAV